MECTTEQVFDVRSELLLLFYLVKDPLDQSRLGCVHYESRAARLEIVLPHLLAPASEVVVLCAQPGIRRTEVGAEFNYLPGIMHYSRRQSFVNEPSFRNFFRARFRAKACFTRRLSPGFK